MARDLAGRRPSWQPSARASAEAALAAVILITSSGAAAAAGAPPAEAYRGGEEVARVDDQVVTLGELMFRFASLPPFERERYAASGGLRALLDDTVASIAIAHEAASRGFEKDPLFAPLVSLAREGALRDIYARRTVLAQLDDAALEKRYEQEKETRFRRPAAALVRHILVTPVADPHPFSSDPDATDDAAARAKAEKLRAEIVAGADFAAVARRASEDATAPSGGDLGWVRPGQLVAAVDKLVFSAEIGKASDVTPSPLGYQIVLVEQRLPAGLLPFAAVRELLFQEMVAERADALSGAARQDREQVLKKHEVTTHPERLP